MFSQKEIAAAARQSAQSGDAPPLRVDSLSLAEREKSGEELLQELLDKSGSKQRRDEKMMQERFSKIIETDVLKNRLIEPAKRITFMVFAVTATIATFVWFPGWRGQWRQRKFMHRFCVGKAVDLMPIIGDETRLPLLEFSRATQIDLAGRRLLASEKFRASPLGNKDGESTATSSASTESASTEPVLKSRARNSLAYQIDEAERREDEAAAAGATAEKEKSASVPPGTGEMQQDVSFEMLCAAVKPDTQLGLSKIHFRAIETEKAEVGSYDTAFITDALCWEDTVIAQNRLRKAWSLVKPGGHLLISDFGRPSKHKTLSKLVDWVESQKVTSVRLTLDYAQFMKDNFEADIEWPAAMDERSSFSFRYTLALQKKKKKPAAAEGSSTADNNNSTNSATEAEPKSEKQQTE